MNLPASAVSVWKWSLESITNCDDCDRQKMLARLLVLSIICSNLSSSSYHADCCFSKYVIRAWRLRIWACAHLTHAPTVTHWAMTKVSNSWKRLLLSVTTPALSSAARTSFSDEKPELSARLVEAWVRSSLPLLAKVSYKQIFSCLGGAWHWWAYLKKNPSVARMVIGIEAREACNDTYIQLIMVVN